MTKQKRLEPIKRDLKKLTPDAHRLVSVACRVFAKKLPVDGLTEDEHLAGMLELLETEFLRLAANEPHELVYLQMLSGWDQDGEEIWITM